MLTAWLMSPGEGGPVPAWLIVACVGLTTAVIVVFSGMSVPVIPAPTSPPPATAPVLKFALADVIVVVLLTVASATERAVPLSMFRVAAAGMGPVVGSPATAATTGVFSVRVWDTLLTALTNARLGTPWPLMPWFTKPVIAADEAAVRVTVEPPTAVDDAVTT